MMHAMKVAIPIALQLAIDDAGWWSGKDGREYGEPARTGIQRDHVPEDYEAIAMLGKKLAMKPQMAMCLCEWDKENILRDLPDSTWMGKEWDNSRWVGPWLEKAADIIRSNAAHLEFTMHGIGHCYWNKEKKMEVLEWFDQLKMSSRPKNELDAHIEFYFRIIEQHNFGSINLETFVAPGSLYGFGDDDDGQTMALKQHGIKYISTDFSNMKQNRPVDDDFFGIDHGIMIVDRKGNYVPWPAIDCDPLEPIGTKPILGLHWPNILNSDFHRNEEIVDRWVALLKKHNDNLNTMLAADTQMCWTQLAYNRGTDIHIDDRTISLDFSRLIELSPQFLSDCFIMKIESEKAIRIVSRDAEIVSLSKSNEELYYDVEVKRSPSTSKAQLEIHYL